jgi:hypothetical protein
MEQTWIIVTRDNACSLLIGLFNTILVCIYTQRETHLRNPVVVIQVKRFMLVVIDTFFLYKIWFGYTHTWTQRKSQFPSHISAIKTWMPTIKAQTCSKCSYKDLGSIFYILLAGSCDSLACTSSIYTVQQSAGIAWKRNDQ